MRRGLQAPLRQIVENAGQSGSVVVAKLLEDKEQQSGFDAQGGNYVDMIEAGIIDPTAVVRTALRCGSSAAGLLITTQAAVVTRVEDQHKAADGRRR